MYGQYRQTTIDELRLSLSIMQTTNMITCLCHDAIHILRFKILRCHSFLKTDNVGLRSRKIIQDRVPSFCILLSPGKELCIISKQFKRVFRVLLRPVHRTIVIYIGNRQQHSDKRQPNVTNGKNQPKKDKSYIKQQ